MCVEPVIQFNPEREPSWTVDGENKTLKFFVSGSTQSQKEPRDGSATDVRFSETYTVTQSQSKWKLRKIVFIKLVGDTHL